MPHDSLNYHSNLNSRYCGPENFIVYVYDFSCAWKESRFGNSPFFASPVWKIDWVTLNQPASTKFEKKFYTSFLNLTKKTRSELDVFWFFGEFFKLPMSQNRQGYKRSLFARSSNKWFRVNFVRDWKQKGNQSRHYCSRNKWSKFQVFPIKRKGTSTEKKVYATLPHIALSGIGIYWLYSWMCDSMHWWMTMKGILGNASHARTLLVCFPTYRKGIQKECC